MVKSGNYTVQATLLEGRNFTRKPLSKVYIQCRFNGEILTTDPVEHDTVPFFDTELAWDLDSKTLSFLRSQRISLKLVCFTIDTANRRESLGYIMLDLRAAVQGLPPFSDRWYPLVNTRNMSTFRPEIKVSFALVNKADLESHLIAQAEQARPKMFTVLKPAIETANPSILVASTLKQLKITVPVSLKDEGYYQVGKGKESFVLWITIAFAEHLLALVEQPVPEDEDPNHYFCYSFLGTNVMTHRFGDLGQPNFPAERVSIRFQSSNAEMSQFLTELNKIVIRLCRKEQTIGFTTVSLLPLVQDSDEPLVVEKVYSLLTPKEELPLSVDGQPPSIGVSLAFSIERQAPSPFLEPKIESVQEKIEGTKVALPHEKEQEPAEEPVDAQVDVPEIKDNVSASGSVTPMPFQKRDEVEPSDRFPVSIPGTPASIGRPVKWHQYRFSIELRSVKEVQVKSANVFFRYFYTPFGTSAPVLTHPTLPIAKSQGEVILPHSFCAFEFVMSPERLSTYLEAVPLLIEMWHKDESTQNVMLGTTSVDLSTVLGMTRMAGPTGQAGPVIQTFDQFMPILPSAQTAAYSRVGELRIIVALEDFGFVESLVETPLVRSKPVDESTKWSVPPVAAPIPSLPEGKRERILSPQTTPQPRQDILSPDVSIHDTEEYKVALELELWRQDEEAKFKAHLVTREAELNDKWALEWKTREKEREELLKHKLESFKTLENRLHLLAAELEGRDKLLKTSEAEWSGKKLAMEREASRKVDEARDASRRLQDEFRHRVEMEKQTTTEAEQSRQKALRERDHWEEKYRALDVEYTEFRKSASLSRESELKIELVKAIEDKLRVEKDLLEATSGKRKYKAELKRVVEELSKAKKQMQLLNENVFSDEKKKMDEFKVQVLAREQLGAVKSDKSTLESLREDLSTLAKAAGLSHDGRASAPLFAKEHEPLKSHSASVGPTNKHMDKERLFELERLTKEKDSLLDTGIYQKDDRLIRELDFRIQEILKF